MELNVHDRDDHCVIEIQGRMDNEASRLRDAVARKVDEGCLRLIVDMLGVPMTNSIGLGMLVEAFKASQAGGCKFALARVQPPVRTVLEYTKLDTVFQICESIEDAVAVVRR